MNSEEKEVLAKRIYSSFQREIPGIVFRPKFSISDLQNETDNHLDSPINNSNRNFIEKLLKKTLIGVNLTKETKKYFSEPEVIEFFLMSGEYPSFEMVYKDKITYEPIPYNYNALEVENLRKQYEKTKKYLKHIDHRSNDLMVVFATKKQLIEKLKDNISLIPDSTKKLFDMKMGKILVDLRNGIDKEIELLIEKDYSGCLWEK